MFAILIQVGTYLPTPDYDEIAAVLRQRGHTIWVATPNESDQLVFHDGAGAAAVLEMPGTVQSGRPRRSLPGKISQLLENWRFNARLRDLIRQKQPDLVQVNQAKIPFPWLFPLGLRGRTRFVLDWRQIAERPFAGRFAKLRRLLHLQKRRIPSRYIYAQACFLHSAGAERVLGKNWEKWGTVVPLAVSPLFLDVDSTHAAADRTDGSPVRFIYIGSLSRVRRLERIILAAEKIQSEANGNQAFSITFVGPDKSGGYYKSFAENLALNGVIEVKPPVPYEEVPDLLLSSDVALAYIPETPLDWRYHPTLKVLEYRAAGVPIIATDFEPNRAVVEDGKNGLLVSNSVDSLAHAMNRFVEDRDFLQQSTSNAQTMRQGLLWKEVALQYESLYLRLMQQGN